MKLGVDCWRIHGTTGVGRYVRNIVQAWANEFSSDVFDGVTLFTPQPIDRSKVSLGGSMEERVLPSSARQIIWQNTVLAINCNTDVLWCPGYVAPLRSSASIVVTTHDATNAIHPELYPLADRVFYRRYYAWCARAAALVITDNEQTQEDVERYYGVDQSRLRVVPLAPDDVFRRLEDRDLVARVVTGLLGDDRPYFLSVGKVSVRRNVPTVIEGLARFRARTGLPHRMVVVGRGPALEDVHTRAGELDLADHVTHLEFVTDEELVALYNGAEAFVTAATYESVSLTALEAQKCGTPVVIPDVPGMRDTVGDIAVIMPGVNASEIAKAMEQLATDGDLRRTLSRDGEEHASGFSWARTAKETLRVAEEAVFVDRG